MPRLQNNDLTTCFYYTGHLLAACNGANQCMSRGRLYIKHARSSPGKSPRHQAFVKRLHYCPHGLATYFSIVGIELDAARSIRQYSNAVRVNMVENSMRSLHAA